MATFYLDPEGGNDANNGTTFALRKRTLASFGATPVGGDVIRVMATPAAVVLGTGTWTDNSSDITALPSGYITIVEAANAAWTAGPTGVTTTTQTTSKIGATSSSFSTLAGFSGAAFPNALVAYRATATNLDLSAYTGLSFWMRKTSAGGNLTPDGRIRIRLCSDAAGTTSLQELSFTYPFSSGTAAITNNQWTPVVLQTNAALPSGINSIAIYMGSSPTASTFIINNIVAIKGDTDPLHISHRSVIGKNTVGEPAYYPIQGFTSSTALQVSPHGSIPTTLRPYRGTTETVNTYVIRPVNPYMTMAQRTAGASGTIGNPIIFSGGWDTTAMSTQSGHTFWGGDYYFSSMLSFTARFSWRFEGFSSTQHSDGPFTLGATTRDIETRMTHMVGTLLPVLSSGATQGSQGDSSIDYVVMPDTGVQNGTTSNTAPCVFRSKLITGSLSNALISGTANSEDTDFLNEVDAITNCAGTAVAVKSAGQVGYLRGCTFNQNLNNVTGSTVGFYLDSCTFTDGFKVTASTGHSGYTFLTNIGNDPQLFRQFHFGYNVISQAAVTDGSSKAVELSVTNASIRTQLAPARVLLATIAVLGGGPVTVTARARRSAVGAFVAGIRVPGKGVQGVVEQTSLASAAVNTWETLSVTFTPTVNGVVELWGFASGAVASAYFDNILVS